MRAPSGRRSGPRLECECEARWCPHHDGPHNPCARVGARAAHGTDVLILCKRCRENNNRPHTEAELQAEKR